ncbi:MAG: tetratricopeptide repeat protein [Tannerella sp.]|jgi:tetratricopeptide (TPR) repeat protein|nr:tetratricopeptide repeat protein [Tannerella sp.]
MQLKYLIFTLIILFANVRHIDAQHLEQQPPAASVQRKVDYIFYEALNLKNANKHDAAFDLLRYCLSLDSTASAVLFELSSYYVQLEQPEKSVSLLKEAVKYSPDNFTYKQALAAISLGIGMYGEAAEEYEELVKGWPEKIELNYYLAQAYIQSGDIGKAIDTFDALESMMGMNETVSMQKYRLYMTLEQPDKAFRELEKLVDEYPGNARYPILIGDLYLEQNKPDKALEYYVQAHAIDPENPYYTVSMANYYEQTNNPQAAEEQIRIALVNDKLDVEVKVAILARYIQQLQKSRNGTEGANALFQTLLEQHPEDLELKEMYAGLLSTQGNNEEARFLLQVVTEMEPGRESAWHQLLNISIQAQDFDEVIKICNKAKELFPKEPIYYFYLGATYYQQKNYQQGIESYQEGLNIIPEEDRSLRSDFYGQIGDLYYQMKKYDEAFAAYDEALRFNEQNIVVLNNYSYFLTLLKRDLEKAERMSAQSIRMEPDNATYLDTYAWVFFARGNYTLAKIYIQRAIEKDDSKNPTLVDHYGDILFMSGDIKGAVTQWKKAKELGMESEILDRKIAEEKYFEDPNAE